MQEINQIESAIKSQLKVLEEFKYLLSVPAVGWWGAAVFLGEVGDPTRLPRARSAVKIAGLNLYRTQSGKSKSGLSITKRSRILLRKAAYRMALSGFKCNREFKDYYERKLERGKPKVSALVALSAKVLRVMYGVVKNQENYKPLTERQTQGA